MLPEMLIQEQLFQEQTTTHGVVRELSMWRRHICKSLRTYMHDSCALCLECRDEVTQSAASAPNNGSAEQNSSRRYDSVNAGD